jgi:hypothetical protein
MNDSLESLDSNSIILSYKNKSIEPRYIIDKKLYPIIIELPKSKCLFGIDKVYDKFYVKLEIINSSFLKKFVEIENRLKKMVLERENVELVSNFYGENVLGFLIDKNIEIKNNLSLFNLKKNTFIECQILLGNIFINKNIANYKWIINKIVFLE